MTSYSKLRLILGDQLNANHSWYKNKNESTRIAEIIDKYLKELKKQKNSIYYMSITKHIRINTLDSAVIPQWITWAGSTAAFLIFLFFTISFILKIIVDKRTKELNNEKDFIEKLRV